MTIEVDKRTADVLGGTYALQYRYDGRSILMLSHLPRARSEVERHLWHTPPNLAAKGESSQRVRLVD